MNVQVDTTPPHSTSQRRRRGQTLAEFALTLPIVLLLMFGIIEFARIFQAWVTLQNAARTAARYAITGQFDVDHLERIADEFATDELGDPAAAALPDTRDMLCQDSDQRGTHADFDLYRPVDTNDYEVIFANYWDGLDCEPGSEQHRGLLNDIARIPSIRDQARVGAAGLDLRIYDDEAYEIETDPDTGDFVRWARDDVPGWFHVYVCSSRPTLREEDDPSIWRYQHNRDNLTCVVAERRGSDLGDDGQAVNNAGRLQWDAGGPGDAVEIIVTFNHPLITPLALPSYVQLQARRVMINEAFRASRVVNLPPVVALPTNTPTNTPLPTDVPPPTDLPTWTNTPTASDTPTATGTATASPTPACTDLYILNVILSGSYLQVQFRNDNFAPFELEGVLLQWHKHTLFPNMYTDRMLWNGDVHWDGTDTNEPTAVGTAPGGPEPTWNTSTNVQLEGNSTATWQVRFGNGPFNLSDYYQRPDFTGSTWYFSNGCTVQIDDPTPTPPTGTPTFTPTPECGNYTMDVEGFWPHGVVQFSVRNGGGTPIQITGIDIRWRYYFSGMALDKVIIGGVNAFDPAGVRIWDGNDPGTTIGQQTNTASGTLGSEPTWLIEAVINPGDTVSMWLDFDGTSGNLEDEYGALPAHFNGTRLAYDNGCDVVHDIPPTPEPVCGDGIRQDWIGEQCDDGNTNNGDGCDSACRLECGNGRIDGSEQCDDGNRTSGDGCSSSCRDEYCGDRTVQSGLGEQCDDGNTNNGDGCSSTCRWEPAVCGNGNRESGEECDDGNTTSGDGCTSTCRREYCGDGTMQSALGEQCDDGNTSNGDGCSSTCQIEQTGGVCGNGTVESGETCDDGNTRNGDGCSSTCQVEVCTEC